MKILNSVSIAYNGLLPQYQRLQAEVDKLVKSIKKDSWHYYSRVKGEESYALKLETGRVKNAYELEDFFACTLVVENLNEISNAIAIVKTKFNIKYRRPKEDYLTHKDSSSFPFDDLRLYLSVKPVDYLPVIDTTNLIFELQVKTFLQHAWSIATHDLIYKSGNISWSKERVAFQIKAMLEQAEVSISGADKLSELPELAKQNEQTKVLNDINHFLLKFFSTESLPNDVIRLSKIINDLMLNFKLRLTDIEKIIEAETKSGRGSQTLNLSPYSIIIQSIINQNPHVFEIVFRKDHRLKTKSIFIPIEIDIDKLALEDISKIVRA